VGICWCRFHNRYREIRRCVVSQSFHPLRCILGHYERVGSNGSTRHCTSLADNCLPSELQHAWTHLIYSSTSSSNSIRIVGTIKRWLRESFPQTSPLRCSVPRTTRVVVGVGNFMPAFRRASLAVR